MSNFYGFLSGVYDLGRMRKILTVEDLFETD